MKNFKSVRLTVSLLFALNFCLPSMASDYIAVAKNGNIYDEANAKYITVNQNNDDISVIPGMIFATSEHTPGWYMIEYSPGLHAFIPDQITASNFNTVTAGTYDIKNNPGQKLLVDNSGGEWVASSNGKSYKGLLQEDFIIFFDNQNNMVFSLVDIGDGPIAITYDNSVTKFF